MRDLNKHIADQLTRLRQGHGWSLDELAERSGVSRATLARIEKAESAATAEALGKICTAYGITLSRLIAMAESNEFSPHIKITDQEIWQDAATGFMRRIVSPPSRDLAGEVVHCQLEPAAMIEYDTSPVAGLEHHLILEAGGLSITVDEQSYQLGAGDCLRYKLHGPSLFKADPKLGAHYYLILIP